MRARIWRAWLGAGLFLGGPGAGAEPPAPFLRTTEAADGIVALEVASRTLTPKGRGPTVTLVGAVHIGESAYYKDLQALLDGHDLVLFESVKPPGLSSQFADDQARASSTEHRIRLVGILVASIAAERGTTPASLDEVRSALHGREPSMFDAARVDAWGRPIELHAVQGGFDLVSLGSDGAPGGAGPAADLRLSEQKPLEPAVSTEGIQPRLARALGLEFQLDAIDYARDHWRNSDLSVDEVSARLEAAGLDGDAFFSMLDGSSLSAKLAGILLGLVRASPTMSVMVKLMLVDMMSHADEFLASAPGDMGRMMDVLLIDRNAAVIADLRGIIEREPDVATVAIFYGAGHLPDLQRRIEELGYVTGEDRWLRAIAVDPSKAGLTPGQATQMRAMMKSAIDRQLDRK